MADEILITVPGKPVAWQRAGHNGKTGHFYTKAKTGNWEAAAGFAAAGVMGGSIPRTGPLCVRVTAYFPVSASWPRWKQDAALQGVIRHTSKPDGDNVLKACKDALTSIVWKDDCQVVIASVTKEYSTHPRVEILVFPAAGVSSQITRRDQLPASSEVTP